MRLLMAPSSGQMIATPGVQPGRATAKYQHGPFLEKFFSAHPYPTLIIFVRAGIVAVATGRGVWVATGRGVWVATGRGVRVATGRGVWVATGRGVRVATGRGVWVATGRGVWVATGRGVWLARQTVAFALASLGWSL